MIDSASIDAKITFPCFIVAIVKDAMVDKLYLQRYAKVYCMLVESIVKTNLFVIPDFSLRIIPYASNLESILDTV